MGYPKRYFPAPVPVTVQVGLFRYRRSGSPFRDAGCTLRHAAQSTHANLSQHLRVYYTPITRLELPGPFSFRDPCLSVFSLPRQGGGRGWGCMPLECPSRASPPHPNLPPPGGKESKAQGGEEKIEN